MKIVFLLVLAANTAYFAWHLRNLEPTRHQLPTVVNPEPDHVNRLLLLSEVDKGELRERRLEPAPPAPETIVAAAATSPNAPIIVGEFAFDAVPDPATGRLCYSAGPLLGDAEVAAMRDWLDARGGAGLLRAGERREIALYWVFFPPFPTRDEAIQRIVQMQAEGIEDMYVIPRGDMANAISLGLYRQRASLDRRLRDLRGNGYEPSIIPRYRTKKAAWFDVEFPADFNFDYPAFATTFPAIEMAPVACPDTPLLSTAARQPAEDSENVPAETFRLRRGAESVPAETPVPADPADPAEPRSTGIADAPERRYFYSTENTNDTGAPPRSSPISPE